MPDVPGVVPDGAVGGEDAGPGDVDERFLIPGSPVLVDLQRAAVGLTVAVKVGQ